MSVDYIAINEAQSYVIRSSDGAQVPWDADNDCPLDLAGLTGRTWQADGSPKSLPYVAPKAAADPIPDITDRQFGRGLWGDGIISFEECEAFVSTGAIPAALQLLVDQLPDNETGTPTPRKEAIILIKGAKNYQRGNPFVDMLGQGFGWSPAQLDMKWRAWLAL